MHRMRLLFVCLCWLLPATALVWGEEYKLMIGDVLKGTVASANEDGLVVKLDVGGFSDRVPWTRLTQETLKKLAQDPKIKEYAEPFIEESLAERIQKAPRKPDIVLRPVTRVELPAGPAGLMALVTSPLNLAVLLLLFAANLYAAYEIAIYRNRPAVLVCGLAVILPVVGPLIFLMLPEHVDAEVYDEAAAGAGANPSASQTGRMPSPAGVVSSLSMAKTEKAESKGLEPAHYKRGEVEFNRRFFETKFSNYFRVVLSDAEKALVIVIRTPRNEYVAQRFPRISSNEIHLQLLRGTQEVSVPFGEITEVILRPKDAR